MELHRVDYTFLASTGRSCMKLLPTGGVKAPQKVIIGDQDGVVQIISFKRGEIQITFKSLPATHISNVVLGGAIGTIQDKIFVTSNNIVRGYTKKGKQFLNFETQLLDPIKSIFVCGNDLIVTAVHNYHHYHDCKLIDIYTCRDIINDVIALNVAKVRRLNAVLACADHVLRTLDGSTITQSFILPNNPTVLYLLNGDGGTTGDHVLVGMQEGQVYLVQITRSSSTIVKWILENEIHKSEVTSIAMFDLLRSGMQDILIGRHDGKIEVYTIIQSDEVTNEYKPPIEKFSYVCNESISSIQGGYVGNTNFEEILVICHTGWLFGLSTEVPEKQLSNDPNDFNYVLSREEEQQIFKLKGEIEELEIKLAKERERYQQFTVENTGGILRLPFVTIRDKLILQKENAIHLIVLECESSIENLLIQSNVPIKVLDSDKNHSVVSYSKCEPNSGNSILVTHRCHANTTRFELKYIVDEGIEGTLQIYVTPQMDPKFCQLKKFFIKPLSLHTRIHNLTVNKSFHILYLKGTFSIAEMHLWITQCLPDLPEKPPNEETITYTFKSTLTDTVLEINYSRGEATLKSDNISTIAVLKDILSKKATNKKIKLDISTSISEECTTLMMKFIDRKLQKFVNLHDQKMLLDGLKDIDSAQTEPIEKMLIPEFKLILENEHKILEEIKQHPFYLERLQKTVINLFIDWHKFKGINVKPKLTTFSNILKNNYNYDDVLAYFSL